MKYKHWIFGVLILGTSLFMSASASAMNNQDFWKLISLIDIKILDEGDEDAALKKLTDVLASKGEAEIIEFEEVLSQHLYKIDGLKWINEAGESSNSDDSFLYARCYVVAKGRDYYQAVLNDPSLMPKSSEESTESLLYVSMTAWAKFTGKNQEDFDFSSSVSYETGSNEAQW